MRIIRKEGKNELRSFRYEYLLNHLVESVFNFTVLDQSRPIFN